MMCDYFGFIRNLVKQETVCIDHSVFHLHKYTVVMLLIFSIFVTLKQYIGQPISCASNRKPIDEMLTSYCWISSTYILYKHSGETDAKALPELGPYPQVTREVKQYTYYQWVCFILLIQAVLFYLPRYVWKKWEGGRIDIIISDIKLVFTDELHLDHRRKLICKHFLSNVSNHKIYFLKFVLCELFSFANVIGQMFLMDVFLNGQFTTYGISVMELLKYSDKDRTDPMSVIFPKVTKCSMDMYGDTGWKKNDALCILPLNNVNEKIYIFLWFWFNALVIMTSLAIVYRFIIMTSVHVRYIILTFKYRLIPKEDLWILCKHFHIGDWFMFYQISKNVDVIFLREFVIELSENICSHERHFVL